MISHRTHRNQRLSRSYRGHRSQRIAARRKKAEEPVAPGIALFNDAIAIWEFGADTGAIGTDKKGVNNASNVVGLQKKSSNSGIDTLALGTTHTVGNQVAYLAIPSTNLDLAGKSFSLAALINLENKTGQPGDFNFYAKHKFNDGERTLAFYHGDLGSERFRFLTGNLINQFNLLQGSPFTDNQWHLLIAEFDFVANLKFLWFDNNLVGSQIITVSIVDDLSDDTYIFGNETSTGVFEPISPLGLIQYVARWDRILTQVERDYLWNDGNFRYIPSP